MLEVFYSAHSAEPIFCWVAHRFHSEMTNILELERAIHEYEHKNLGHHLRIQLCSLSFILFRKRNVPNPAIGRNHCG